MSWTGPKRSPCWSRSCPEAGRCGGSASTGRSSRRSCPPVTSPCAIPIRPCGANPIRRCGAGYDRRLVSTPHVVPDRNRGVGRAHRLRDRRSLPPPPPAHPDVRTVPWRWRYWDYLGGELCGDRGRQNPGHRRTACGGRVRRCHRYDRSGPRARHHRHRSGPRPTSGHPSPRDVAGGVDSGAAPHGGRARPARSSVVRSGRAGGGDRPRRDDGDSELQPSIGGAGGRTGHAPPPVRTPGAPKSCVRRSHHGALGGHRGRGRPMTHPPAKIAAVALGACLFSVGALAGGAPALSANNPSQLATSTIPATLISLFQRVSATSPCGVPWTLLAAVADTESAFDPTAVSDAGAQGLFQFEPATFATYAQPVPDTGAVPPSPFDPVDAAYAAGRSLCSLGVVGDPTSALVAYNCGNPGPACQAASAGYAEQVLATAAGYTASDSSGAAIGMSNGVPNVVQAAAVAYAESQIGTPYVWGGASPQGGVDCSGRGVWGYGLAGVLVPRGANDQWQGGAHVALDP